MSILLKDRMRKIVLVVVALALVACSDSLLHGGARVEAQVQLEAGNVEPFDATSGPDLDAASGDRGELDAGVADRRRADRELDYRVADRRVWDRGKLLDHRPADQPKPADQGSVSGFTFYAVNHVLVAGQSLALGATGSPALTTSQPYDNKMFNGGVIGSRGTNLTSFVPLVESGEETMASSMANLITKLAREQVFTSLPPPKSSHDLLVSCHAVSGTGYWGLRKGTQAYADGMAQVKAGKSIAASLGLSYVVRAVTLVHGEDEAMDKNTAYAQQLAAWQADYDADIKAITGQSEPVPMFQTQVSSWTVYADATSVIPILQLQASAAAPNKIVMVGPKYSMEYTDGYHLTADSYRRMGEYYAKAYRRVVLEGGRWEPLRPRSVTRSGAQITVKFHVPAPPLAFDTTLVSAVQNKGFEYTDGSGAPPSITGVALSGQDSVVVTLSQAPTGNNRRIRYAYTGVEGAHGGPTTGPRGNLRDSDTTPSRVGNKLYNWAVHFDEAVP